MSNKYGDHWQETHAIEVFAEPDAARQLELAIFISPSPRAYAQLCAKLIDKAKAILETFDGHDILTSENPDQHH